MENIYQRISRNTTVLIFVITGVTGFYLGSVYYGTWQAALESSQVLAGVVKYPPSNPFYIYHVKLWTLINQIPAIFLYFGVSEIRLSLVISGIIGMLFFQAIAFIVWTLSRNFLLAVSSPIILYFYIMDGYFTPLRRFYDSTVYPIFLMGQEHTYGGISLSFILLTFSFIGGGFYRLGSLFMGLAPAVHPSLGIWCLGILAVTLMSDRRNLSLHWKNIVTFGTIGIVLSIVSLIIQLDFASCIEAPDISREMKMRYLLAFSKNSDMHRQPVKLLSWGMLAHLSVVIVSLQWLISFKNDLSQSSRLMLKAFLIMAIFSILLSFLSWIPDKIPMELLVAMPGRLQNVVLLAFPVLLIGLLGSQKERLPHLIALEILLVAMLSVYVMHLSIEANKIPVFVSLGIVTALAISGYLRNSIIFPKLARMLRRVVQFTAAVAVIMLSYHMAVNFDSLQNTWKNKDYYFVDWSNNPAFAHIKNGEGVLLTSSDIGRIQLVARRSVLLNGGALNQITYALESGPIMDSILKEIYGVDLFNAPPGAISSALKRSEGKGLWESRSRLEWLYLAQKYGFTNVMTYHDWMLDLPVEMQFEVQGQNFILYSVF